MLKFEALAEIGDVIRAYDFQTMGDKRDGIYVEGKVIAKGDVTTDHMYKAYTIEVTKDTRDEFHPDYSRVGQKVYVPFGLTFDWSGRVEKVNSGSSVKHFTKEEIAVQIVEMMTDKNFGVGGRDFIGDYVTGPLFQTHGEAVNFEDKLRTLMQDYHLASSK